MIKNTINKFLDEFNKKIYFMQHLKLKNQKLFFLLLYLYLYYYYIKGYALVCL